MKEMIFVRHAETNHTLERRFSGVSDPFLCEYGRETAGLTAEYLKDVEFDFGFCSPWNRTRETMEIINKANKRGFEFVQDKRLAEVNFGMIEGMLFTELETHYPEHAMDFKKDWQKLTLEGGDNLLDYYNRATKVFEELGQNDGRILVVTHTGFIGSSIAYRLGQAEEIGIYSRHIPPGSAWKFTKSGFDMLFSRNKDEQA